jgi:hypothetical protein
MFVSIRKRPKSLVIHSYTMGNTSSLGTSHNSGVSTPVSQRPSLLNVKKMDDNPEKPIVPPSASLEKLSLTDHKEYQNSSRIIHSFGPDGLAPFSPLSGSKNKG